MSTELLQRVFTILEHIPAAPAKLSTGELFQRLQDNAEVGFTKRTLERYLALLESNYLLCCFTEGKTNYWCRHPDKYLFGERLTSELALAYVLAEAPLKQNAPEALLETYRNRIHQAHRILSQDKLGDWQKRVIQVSGSFPPLAIAFEQQIKNTLYQALFEQSCVTVQYQAAGSALKTMLLHPYGLINAGERKYLIATDTPTDLSSVRLFALQRFKAAEVNWQQLQTPEGLDLQHFSNQGLSGWRIQEEPITVQLQAKGVALQQLQDSALALEQEPVSHDVYQLQFVTPLTYELVRWCIAMGDDLFIISPDNLIAEIMALRKDPLKPFALKESH